MYDVKLEPININILNNTYIYINDTFEKLFHFLT